MNRMEWLSLAGSIPEACIQAALAISIHRYVLLEEVLDRVAVPRTLRDIKFAFWLILTRLLAQAPFMLGVTLGEGHKLFVQLASASMVFFIVLIGLRLTVLFPAIALDQPNPLTRSWRLSKSHAWQILWTSLLIVLPFTGLVFPLMIYSHKGLSKTIIALILALNSTLAASVFAAMASMFYRLFSSETVVRISPESFG